MLSVSSSVLPCRETGPPPAWRCGSRHCAKLLKGGGSAPTSKGGGTRPGRDQKEARKPDRHLKVHRSHCKSRRPKVRCVITCWYMRTGDTACLDTLPCLRCERQRGEQRRSIACAHVLPSRRAKRLLRVATFDHVVMPSRRAKRVLLLRAESLRSPLSIGLYSVAVDSVLL